MILLQRVNNWGEWFLMKMLKLLKLHYFRHKANISWFVGATADERLVALPPRWWYVLLLVVNPARNEGVNRARVKRLMTPLPWWTAVYISAKSINTYTSKPHYMVVFNPKNADFFMETSENKGLFQFELIKNVLVSSFRLIWITMLWVYGHYKYVFYFITRLNHR